MRNPDYWQKDKVKLESVTFRFINDPQAQVAAVKAGDVDAFPTIGAPELFADLKKDPRFTAVAGNTEGETVAGLNNTRKPFDDPRVRRAHARHRPQGARGRRLFGLRPADRQPLLAEPPGLRGYDERRSPRPREGEGPEGGRPGEAVPDHQDAADGLCEPVGGTDLRHAVGGRRRPEDRADEFPAKWIEEVFRNKDYDDAIVSHTEPLDIDIYARDTYYFNYKSDKLKAAVAEASKTTDEKARFAKYAEAQKILAEDVPALFLFQLPKLGVWNAKLKGMWENTPIRRTT